MVGLGVIKKNILPKIKTTLAIFTQYLSCNLFIKASSLIVFALRLSHLI